MVIVVNSVRSMTAIRTVRYFDFHLQFAYFKSFSNRIFNLFIWNGQATNVMDRRQGHRRRFLHRFWINNWDAVCCFHHCEKLRSTQSARLCWWMREEKWKKKIGCTAVRYRRTQYNNPSISLCIHNNIQLQWEKKWIACGVVQCVCAWFV